MAKITIVEGEPKIAVSPVTTPSGSLPWDHPDSDPVGDIKKVYKLITGVKTISFDMKEDDPVPPPTEDLLIENLMRRSESRFSERLELQFYAYLFEYGSRSDHSLPRIDGSCTVDELLQHREPLHENRCPLSLQEVGLATSPLLANKKPVKFMGLKEAKARSIVIGASWRERVTDRDAVGELVVWSGPLYDAIPFQAWGITDVPAGRLQFELWVPTP